MANIKSAQKRARQNEVRSKRQASQNLTLKNEMKDFVKKEGKEAGKNVNEMKSMIGKAVKRGLPKNKAARMQRRVDKLAAK